MTVKICSVAVVAALSVPLSATAVFAADVEAPASPGLEEVIVTAQKRSESVQDVPVSISAFGAQELRDMRLDDVTELVQHVPNLASASTLGGGVPIFALRGVSMNDYSPNQSSPVAVYSDEVYRGTPALMGPQLYDLDRVEVLRGPQGTLYGKNTTGGAVNFITARPGRETGGYVTFDLGNYGRYDVKGALQAPLGETLAVRLAYMYASADGYTRNVTPGKKDMDGVDQYGIRLSMLWEPNDNLSVMLRLATAESSGTAHGIEPIAGEAGVGGGVYGLFNSIDPTINPATDYFPSGKPHRTGSNRVYDATVDTDSLSLTVNYDLSDQLRLVSITSFDDGTFKLPEDSDGSPLDVLFIPYDFDAKQFAQDLRLVSDFDGPFGFILGAYFSQEEVNGGTSISAFNDLDLNFDGALDYQDCIASTETIGTPEQLFPAGCTVANHYEQVRDSAALYFDGSYELTAAVKLRFGLRYTHDSGDIRKFRSLLKGSDGVPLSNLIPGSANIPGPATRRSYSDDRVTGRLGLDYTTAGGNLLYVSLSQGYRASAFNGQAFFDPVELNVVDPETLVAAEAGFKLDLLGETLRLNGSVFRYGYKDQQFLNVDAATAAQQLVNVPESTIYGGEIEGAYRLSNRIKINASIALLQSEINRGQLSGAKLAGNSLPLAPESSFTAGVTWDVASLNRGDVVFMLDGSYVASQYFDVFNDRATRQSSYTVGNARLAFRSRGEGFEAAFWIKNLADEDYYSSMINLLDNFGYVYALRGSPRMYGVEATWRFQK